jgi:hypothetical protein
VIYQTAFESQDDTTEVAASGFRERTAIKLAFVIYLLFQVNAIAHHGSWGQDLGFHLKWIYDAAADPWRFIFAIDPYRPEPPFFYLLAALIQKLTGGVHWLEMIALVSLAANCAGLIIFYRLLRLMVRSSLLRLACFFFVLFLPVFMIHSIVLASDAFILPLFIGIVYFVTELGSEAHTNRFSRSLTYAAVLLALGIGTKFTFVSLSLAIVLTICIFWRVGSLSRRRAIVGLIVFTLMTVAGVALILRVRNIIVISGSGFQMNWTDILLLHTRDLHVLSAPPYGELAKGKKITDDIQTNPFELLTPHRYSFAALAHLGIFTDTLNIFQYDPTDGNYGARSRRNMSRMRLAVKTGLLFSLSGIFLILWAIGKSCYFSLWRKQAAYNSRTFVAVAGFGWFLNIVIFLPSVPAYVEGFWLPRLYLPALLCFCLLTATALDDLLALRSLIWRRAILALVLFQSLVQLSFLWPWGLMACRSF